MKKYIVGMLLLTLLWTGIIILGQTIEITSITHFFNLSSQPSKWDKYYTEGFLQLKRCTVEIKSGKTGGAGTIIAVDNIYLYILTAKHVAGIKATIQITDDTGYRHIVSSDKISAHDKIDLALIRIKKPNANFSFLTLGAPPVLVGTPIYTIGHPGGAYYNIRQGIVSGYSKRSSDGVMTTSRYAIITAPSYSGGSGGAVVNNMGELVGIAVGINVRKDVPLVFMTYSVMLEDIQDFLYKNGVLVRIQ